VLQNAIKRHPQTVVIEAAGKSDLLPVPPTTKTQQMKEADPSRTIEPSLINKAENCYL
jgi:hypothetical protein